METAKNFGEVFTPTSTVDYSNEKPVFVKLLEVGYGGVNLLALSAGQKLAEHTAPGSVLIYVLEGQVEFIIDQQPKELKQGQAILLQAGAPHSVNAVQDTKIMLVKIDN